MAFYFFGGVHPKENKSFAESQPIMPFPAPGLLVIPMSSTSGPPASPW